MRSINFYETLFTICTGIFLILPVQANASCFDDSIVSPSPFLGNNGEIFKLASGKMGEVKYEYEYMYEYFPSVTVCPAQGKMMVGSTTLRIQMLGEGKVTPSPKSSNRSAPPSNSESFIESTVDGNFECWDGETIVKLRNGQVWQQTEYAYEYSYSYAPEVMIFKKSGSWVMKVNSCQRSVRVERLK